MTRQLATAITVLLLAALGHHLGHPVLTLALGALGTVLMIAALSGFNVPHTALMTFGLALALWAPFSIWGSLDLLRHSSAAEGLVVRLQHTDAGRWGRVVPRVRFRTGSGRNIEFDVPENLYEPRWHDTVVVRYDPAEPEQSARLAGFLPMFGQEVIGGTVGIGLATLGFVLARRYRAGVRGSGAPSGR